MFANAGRAQCWSPPNAEVLGVGITRKPLLLELVGGGGGEMAADLAVSKNLFYSQENGRRN